MKPYTKIVLLVAIALFLTLTACTRQASKQPVALATSTGEAPFPFTTPGGVNSLGTQTAIAANPGAIGLLTGTPEVILATGTPAAGAGESGGGQVATATPSAAQAVNTPVITAPDTYTLQKGEWPICIARRYGVDISALFTANGMNMNSKPSAGATLKIPSGSSWNSVYGARALKAHPTSYTVSAGETVYTIACKFGDVAPESIMAVNGLSSASDLQSGSTIQIP